MRLKTVKLKDVNKFKFSINFTFFLLVGCGKDTFTFPSAREVPVDASQRVEKIFLKEEELHLEIRGGSQGGVFDFASSNEMWRASIEILDFVSFTNASYSGGIIITDWFSGNVSDQEDNSRELKITVRFLSNEVRADGIKIIVHEKTCLKVNTDCKIQKIESEISTKLN